MSNELLVLLIFVELVFALMSANLAAEKGYSAVVGLVGFVFGPFGLLYAVGLPDKHARPNQKS